MHRREFLWQGGGGLGGIALAALLAQDGLLAADLTGGVARPRADGGVHHAPRARRVVQLFMAGAASHIDLFDFKPELIKRHGQPSDFGEHVEAFQNGLGPWLRPVFGLQALWLVRQDAWRSRRGPRGRGRRHRLRPQRRGQDRRPQPGDAAPDDGLQPAGIPVDRLVGQLRARPHDRQPAGVRRHARPPRARVQRHQELGPGVPAVAAPGDRDLSRVEDPDRRPVPGRPRRVPDPRCRRGGDRGAQSHEPRALGDPRRRRPARGPDQELRAGRARCSSPRPRPWTSRASRGRCSGCTGSTTASRRSTRRSTRSRRSTASAASAWPPAGCSSAGSGSSRSGAATTTASRGGTGTRTRTSSATTARWPRAWPAAPRP